MDKALELSMRPVDIYATEYPSAKRWVGVHEVKTFIGDGGAYRARVKASCVPPDRKVTSADIVQGDVSVFFDVALSDAPHLGDELCVAIFTATQPQETPPQ